MTPVTVGLVADPAKPTEIARRFGAVDSTDGARHNWDIEVVSEPFTLACEDVDSALSRLTDQAQEHRWDLVVGLTELPLRDGDGRYLLVETDSQQRTAVLSLPALGGLRMHSRSRNAVRELVRGLGDPDSESDRRVPLSRRGGRWRLLMGMCSPTGRGCSCPGSSPLSSRRSRPARSPPSTRRSGSWLARCRGGVWSSRRSCPSRSSSVGS